MRRAPPIGVVLVSLSVFAPAARADDILVPGDFRDLQEALDSARPGDTVLLGRGTFRGPFTLATDRVTIVGEEGTRILGPGLRRDDDRVPPALVVAADGVSVQGVSFLRGGVEVAGDDAALRDCSFRRIASRRREAFAVLIEGDRADLEGGEVLLGGRLPMNSTGVFVNGEDASISGVGLTGSPHCLPIQVSGDGARVEGNTIATLGVNGIILNGAEGTVADNTMQGALLDVWGDGNAVTGNVSTGVPFGMPSILVQGDGNVLEDNEARYGGDTGVVVVGEGNLLRRNTVANNGTIQDGARLGHGFVVRGSGNRLEGNSVLGCVGEGFRVVENLRWNWDAWCWEPGPGNEVVGCSGTGAGTCGLGNWTTGTDVTGSTFTDNGVDVVDGGGFDQFEGNTYDTGGPGFQGSGNGNDTPDFGTGWMGGGGD